MFRNEKATAPEQVTIYRRLLPVFRQVEELLTPAYSKIANLQDEIGSLHLPD